MVFLVVGLAIAVWVVAIPLFGFLFYSLGRRASSVAVEPEATAPPPPHQPGWVVSYKVKKQAFQVFYPVATEGEALKSFFRAGVPHTSITAVTAQP